DSSPRQAWLAGQLGLTVPTYAHVPLVLNRDGQRLAKRDGAVTLADLSAQGVSPDRVLAQIAVSLGDAVVAKTSEAPEAVTMRDLRSRFDPDLLPLDPWVYEGEL